MISKTQKVAVIIIVFAVAISGLIYLMLPPPETASEAMILTPKEIGAGWRGFKEMGDGTSMPGEISRSEWGYDKNGSLEIWIHLVVFNSTETCDAAFEYTHSRYANDTNNWTSVPIGNKAIRVYFGATPIYLFMRENVLCWTIDVTFWGIPPQPWHEGVLLSVIGLQLEKIDQYLAQHPGAN